MYVTAHRGFDDYYPENTVGAISRAARTDGVDAVEFDVRRCGSGELVVIHHDHVGTISESSGDVNELSVSELAAVSVEGSGEGVPQLDEVLDVVPPEIGINVELKETRIAEDVLDAVSGIDNDVALSALGANINALWEARLADESAALVCNFGVRPSEGVETADLIGCVSANPHWAICLAGNTIDRAHDLGLEVHPWPVSSPVVTEVVRRRGVDGIIASTPKAMRPVGEDIDLDGLFRRVSRSA
jgi:glycerophosphoryl diester phosphodiesterase